MDRAQFILLPRSGVFPAGSSDPASKVLRALPSAVSTERPAGATTRFGPGSALWDMEIIDSIAEIKLVAMSPAAVAEANAPSSPVRALPLVRYGLPRPTVSPQISVAAAGTHMVVVECTDATTGAALAGCEVIAFDDYGARRGDQGTTGASGQVSLRLSSPIIERLYVESQPTYWGAYRANVPARGTIPIPIAPVTPSHVDGVRSFYGLSRLNAATGVTVGVIDTGVGPHGDLNVLSGRNTVTGEPGSDYADWNGHGTHVAGLIGADGGGGKPHGVAPGIGMRAYRVFGKDGSGTTNYAVLKALIFAVAEGCDIVNLSLGGGPYDEIVQDAILDVRHQGTLAIIAAGNDGRRAVSYPARYPGATAVTALGVEGSFPAGSRPEAEIERPPVGTRSDLFIAGFSNVGPEIAITAPGVGAVSTLPGGGYGQMSGTSMAAPVAAGAAASLLSQNSRIFAMKRDAARSDAIERLLTTHCNSLGFGSIFEGHGLPDPAAV